MFAAHRAVRWQVALSSLAVALIGGCTGGQTGSEGQSKPPDGAGYPACEESSDPALASKYDFTAEQVLQTALGTWTGRYPGGDVAKPFDVTVTVTRAETDPDADAGAADFVSYRRPRVFDAGAERDAYWHKVCVNMAVRANVRVHASDSTFDARLDWLTVWGDAFKSKPFSGGKLRELPPGVVVTNTDVDVPPRDELGYGFAFGSDGKLWIGIYREGGEPAPIDYVLSGARE